MSIMQDTDIILQLLIMIIFISSINEEHTYNTEKQQTMRTYIQNSANIHVPGSGIIVKEVYSGNFFLNRSDLV